jgi:cytochrome c2
MDMPNRILAALALSVSLGGIGALPAAAQEVDEELAAEGESVFRRCQACHQVGPDAQTRVGPVLTGVVGREAATVEGFNYSEAMQEAGANGLVWTEEELNSYLEAPREKVPGTNMAFPGLPNEEDRLAVIEYIKQQSM